VGTTLRWNVSKVPYGAASQTEGVAVMEDHLSEFDLILVRLLYLFPLVVWGLLIYFAFS